MLDEWFIFHFERQRAQREQEEDPLPYTFAELTIKDIEIDAFILAVAGGDPIKYRELCDMQLSEVFRLYGMLAAQRWKPNKPK